jgi:hypothetical protein
MKATRKLGRRSFMGRVIGGLAAGGALGLIGGEARAWQPPYTGITDSDSGSNSDNEGFGRGGSRAVSDNDSGPNADPAGHGRNTRGRTQPQNGITDGDASDPRGNGRGAVGPYHASGPLPIRSRS